MAIDRHSASKGEAWALSGRERERETLDRLLASDRAEMLALYGRRRVGKTFLVRRFFAERGAHYFEMVGQYQGRLEEQLAIFARALAAAFPGREAPNPSSWPEAFAALAAAIEARGRPKRKQLIFLDELPWIASHRSGCLPALEHFWNSWCVKRGDIVLVVCGSAAAWMRQKIVNARGGLHNRLTATIRLLPFTLAETQRYLEDRKLRMSEREIVELYMSLGGVPHYLDHLARGRSIPQQIDAICLDKDAPLADEHARLFASLFDDDDKYLAVVRALAKRPGGLDRNALIAKTKLASGGGLTTILENLEEGGFIRTVIPFGRRSRDRILRLADPFCLFHAFWLEGRRPRSWLELRKTPRWYTWAGLAFERVCLDHVDAIRHGLGISGVRAEASAWRGEGAQIDLLIDRADDVISVCELKFSEGPFVITKRYAAELRAKLERFRAETGTRKGLQLAFVTPYGVAENAYSRDLVDAELRLSALFTPSR